MSGAPTPAPVVIVAGGGGQHASVVLEAALLAGATVAGVLVLTGAGRREFGVPVLGGEERLADADFLRAHALAPAAGDYAFRRRVADAVRLAGGGLATVIHPAAIVAPSASVGSGCALLAGAIVATNAAVGDLCIVNHGASVGHDAVLERGVNLCPGGRLAGGVVCREGAFVGLGALVIQGRTVGRHAVVGAGAVVVSDVADGTTVVGNPARPVVRLDPRPGLC
jgi:acetyltransferase EpsM